MMMYSCGYTEGILGSVLYEGESVHCDKGRTVYRS